MSKVLFSLLGTSVTAVVGYILFKNNSTSNPEKTFKNQYPEAILKAESNLWNSKFKSLKDGGQPTHATLALAKSKIGNDETEAKTLHRRGCEEIYNSKFKETAYLNDFQLYCSKNLKDVITTPKTWITDDNTKGNKWDSKLTSLSTHDTQQGELDESLSALKTTLSQLSQKTWTNEHRKNLKDWCDAAQTSIFSGDKELKFIHAGLYCMEG
ncbi:hypothetical protein MHC_03425 [Mycoplasma haemocanis str. Illinois]|uniref:Uncharacterized protein n=1 Tax=Mycoplasma haemocanis (strain Illinois) TaxID=1111676 RepID=H6N7C3_MYCHN|nr:hypothetical protein [Mycoplasma haemocanis]AEW45545.1 hypothetical protein MHC_03425 [Mycoplasma haemocanis str. Illinois]